MFKKARLKLSLFYVLIIAIGMIIFSVIFYSYSVRDIKHDISQDTTVTAQVRTNILNHTLDELETSIIIANIVILIVLGFLSYVLAGKTLDPIHEALGAQERFSANASHELRTPLAIMKIENELFLQDSKITPETARLLAQSNLEEINRMAGMVDSLLSLARSKTIKQTMRHEPVPLSGIAQSIGTRIQKLNASKNIQLALSIEPNVTISGDKKLIEQALTNIIQNAFAYTNQGMITINVRKNNSEAITTISDSGIGINEKDLGRITEPFFKTDTSRNQSPTSMGLGLSIVQEIVTLHKGTLAIASTLHKGTNVTITMPLG